MTENLELKQQFITLRAKGYSLEKIAKQIGKCRQTLSNWNSDLQEEIANAKAIELEALFEECLLSKEHRVKELSLGCASDRPASRILFVKAGFPRHFAICAVTRHRV